MMVTITFSKTVLKRKKVELIWQIVTLMATVKLTRYKSK